MKATIISFALVVALHGRAMAQEPSAPSAGLERGSALCNDESSRPRSSGNAPRRENKLVEGSRSRAETPCQ